MLYFLHAPSVRRIKIGLANGDSVEKRIEVLKVASPVDLVLLATFPGGLVEEQALHAKHDALRKRGEWFGESPELWADIEAAKAGTLEIVPAKVVRRYRRRADEIDLHAQHIAANLLLAMAVGYGVRVPAPLLEAFPHIANAQARLDAEKREVA